MEKDEKILEAMQRLEKVAISIKDLNDSLHCFENSIKDILLDFKKSEKGKNFEKKIYSFCENIEEKFTSLSKNKKMKQRRFTVFCRV